MGPIFQQTAGTAPVCLFKAGQNSRRVRHIQKDCHPAVCSEFLHLPGNLSGHNIATSQQYFPGMKLAKGRQFVYEK